MVVCLIRLYLTEALIRAIRMSSKSVLYMSSLLLIMALEAEE
jgi:hypothetical protein